MANTIKLKRASGSDPGNSDLSVGELAIRTSNCKLFSKNDGGSAIGIVAGSADSLTTARTIAGVSFDGSGNISLNNNAITNGAGYIADIVSDTSPQLGGNLDVNGNDIISASNGDIDLRPNGTGAVVFKGVSGNGGNGAGRFKLNCENNSHGITIQGPPHSAAANYTLTLPNDDGSSGQALITDGSGVLSFSTISSVGGSTGVDFNDNVKARFGTGNDFELFFDGTTGHIKGIAGVQSINVATSNVERYQFTDGSIRPLANNTYDLGTSSLRWRNIYTNDLNLSNEGSSNDVDGTWGNWTIQEGESDLFLKNNRSGKKYKFNLTEVA